MVRVVRVVMAGAAAEQNPAEHRAARPVARRRSRAVRSPVRPHIALGDLPGPPGQRVGLPHLPEAHDRDEPPPGLHLADFRPGPAFAGLPCGYRAGGLLCGCCLAGSRRSLDHVGFGPGSAFAGVLRRCCLAGSRRSLDRVGFRPGFAFARMPRRLSIAGPARRSSVIGLPRSFCRARLPCSLRLVRLPFSARL
ncbi:hypothetical protein ACFYRZ_06305, partial [Streptomyces avermitilis]